MRDGQGGLKIFMCQFNPKGICIEWPDDQLGLGFWRYYCLGYNGEVLGHLSMAGMGEY